MLLGLVQGVWNHRLSLHVGQRFDAVCLGGIWAWIRIPDPRRGTIHSDSSYQDNLNLPRSTASELALRRAWTRIPDPRRGMIHSDSSYQCRDNLNLPRSTASEVV